MRGRPRGTPRPRDMCSSLPAGPMSCRLAGNGPSLGTGTESAGTPARFTGQRAARHEQVVAILERRREDGEGRSHQEVDLGERGLERRRPGSRRTAPGGVRTDAGPSNEGSELQTARGRRGRCPQGPGRRAPGSVCQASTTNSMPAWSPASSQPGHGQLGTGPAGEPQRTLPLAERSGGVRLDGDPSDPHLINSSSAATAKPGSRSSMPDTRPDTSRAIGPTVSKLGESGHTPSSGMRPHVVFKPAVPQQAEGIRTEPPVSLPRHVGLVGGDGHGRAARRPARAPGSGRAGSPGCRTRD